MVEAKAIVTVLGLIFSHTLRNKLQVATIRGVWGFTLGPAFKSMGSGTLASSEDGNESQGHATQQLQQGEECW